MFRSISKDFSEHSGGSAFVANGVIYYSPNSSRQLTVPTYRDDSDYRFCESDAKIDHFRSPEWWTRAYGVIA